jgi:hypothetical protein
MPESLNTHKSICVMLAESNKPLDQFLTLLSENLKKEKLVKVILSKNRSTDKDFVRMTMRPIEIKKMAKLSVVCSYKTRDITKNLDYLEGISQIKSDLGTRFFAAHLFTIDEEWQLDITKKGKISLHTSTKTHSQPQPDKAHNKQKKRFVELERPYLQALGVTDGETKLIPAMSRKWKQINKFIEIFSGALEHSSLDLNHVLQVVDFGSGKGYLTFAIHDFLREQLKNPALVTGVELRTELAELCNITASNLQHSGLKFVCGDVKTHAPQHTDVMIALHACDTATDYAINYGIRAGASIIMCSPCCHKQIRPQMHSPTLLKPMLQYGVHLGQQAEIVTDSLRALLLEAEGYDTKVFEFVSLEHTNKNKMILATKSKVKKDRNDILQQITEIKAFYGITEHCLETLLDEDSSVETTS